MFAVRLLCSKVHCHVVVNRLQLLALSSKTEREERDSFIFCKKGELCSEIFFVSFAKVNTPVIRDVFQCTIVPGKEDRDQGRIPIKVSHEANL